MFNNLRKAAMGMEDPNAMPQDPNAQAPQGDPAAGGGGQQDPCAMLQEVMTQLPPEMQQGAQQAIQSGQCEEFIMQLQQQMQGGGDPNAQPHAQPPAGGAQPPQGQPMMRNGGMLRKYEMGGKKKRLNGMGSDNETDSNEKKPSKMKFGGKVGMGSAHTCSCGKAKDGIKDEEEDPNMPSYTTSEAQVETTSPVKEGELYKLYKEMKMKKDLKNNLSNEEFEDSYMLIGQEERLENPNNNRVDFASTNRTYIGSNERDTYLDEHRNGDENRLKYWDDDSYRKDRLRKLDEAREEDNKIIKKHNKPELYKKLRSSAITKMNDNEQETSDYTRHRNHFNEIRMLESLISEGKAKNSDIQKYRKLKQM